MRKYIIMGIQGSGKGTHAKLLAETHELEHISVGDIFRWNIQHHTKLAPRSGAVWPPASWSPTTWSRPWSIGARASTTETTALSLIASLVISPRPASFWRAMTWTR